MERAVVENEARAISDASEWKAALSHLLSGVIERGGYATRREPCRDVGGLLPREGVHNASLVAVVVISDERHQLFQGILHHLRFLQHLVPAVCEKWSTIDRATRRTTRGKEGEEPVVV